MPKNPKKSTIKADGQRKTLIGGNSASLGRTFLGLHKADADTVTNLVTRLTENSKSPDANRTGANKEMGIFNSFACKGW